MKTLSANSRRDKGPPAVSGGHRHSLRELLLVGVLLCLAGVALSGCVENDGNTTTDTSAPDMTTEQPTARFRLLLKDEPTADDVSAINLHVLRVEACGVKGCIQVGGESMFDLLELVGGRYQLLGDILLPPGAVDQLRLVLGDDNTITANGETFPLKVPSGQQSGLKIVGPWPVSGGALTTLLLDMDPDKSVVHNRGQGYILKPVIKVEDVEVVPLPASVALVDPEGGGYLRMGDAFVLQAQPGSVDDTSILTVREIKTDGITSIFEMGPDGTTFDVPVLVTLKYREDRLPAGYPEDHLVLLHDGEPIPTVVDTTQHTLSGEISSFSQIRGDVILSLGGPDVDYYVASGEGCPTPSSMTEGCKADVTCKANDSLSISCDGREEFSLSCVELSFEHNKNDNTGTITAEFMLTDDEVAKFTADPDNTIEWQLKFFQDKSNGHAVMTGWNHAGTDLPGTVADSNCHDDEELYADPGSGWLAREAKAALVTLCPQSLEAGRPYYIRFTFDVDEQLLNSATGDELISRGFKFEAIQGRLCDECGDGPLWTTPDVRDVCHAEVQAPEGETSDSNFSWNCEDRTIEVIGVNDKLGGQDANLVPFENIIVQFAGGSKTLSSSGTCFPDGRVDASSVDQVVLDQDDPDVSVYGPESYWKYMQVGYNGDTACTLNNDPAHGVENRRVYLFKDLTPSTRYRVEVFIPSNCATTRKACYYVSSGSSSQGLRVDQSIYFDQWVPLGVFEVEGTTLSVDLEDMTDEPWLNYWVGFDAVRIVPVNEPLGAVRPGCIDEPATGGSSSTSGGSGECSGALWCPFEPMHSILQGFGAAATFNGTPGVHLAADVDGEAGDSVLATCAGPIVYSGEHRGYGSYRDYQELGPVTLQQCSINMVDVVVMYGHCRTSLPVGARPEPGDVICNLTYYEGSTVGSDWSHLHWGARLGTFSLGQLGEYLAGYASSTGAWVNPSTWSP